MAKTEILDGDRGRTEKKTQKHVDRIYLEKRQRI